MKSILKTSKVSRPLSTLIVFLLSATLVQCGKKDDSSNVDLIVFPDEPIVITADTIIDEEDVKAPWYSVRFKVANNTPNKLTIMGFKFVQEGIDETGNVVTATTDATASEFNQDIAVGAATCKYEFFNFDTIEPGKTVDLTLTDANPEGSIPPSTENPSGVQCPGRTAIPVFYITGPSNTVNYKYKVTVELLGWFGTATEIQDRLQKKVIFRTR